MDSSKIDIHGNRYGGFILGLLLVKDAQSGAPIIQSAITESAIIDLKNYGNFNNSNVCQGI